MTESKYSTENYNAKDLKPFVDGAKSIESSIKDEFSDIQDAWNEIASIVASEDSDLSHHCEIIGGLYDKLTEQINHVMTKLCDGIVAHVEETLGNEVEMAANAEDESARLAALEESFESDDI